MLWVGDACLAPSGAVPCGDLICCAVNTGPLGVVHELHDIPCTHKAHHTFQLLFKAKAANAVGSSQHLPCGTQRACSAVAVAGAVLHADMYGCSSGMPAAYIYRQLPHQYCSAAPFLLASSAPGV